jgi:formate/nitrite transporter FocA (FNT family)
MSVSLKAWLVSLILVLLVFYGIDHLVMSMQGLPLNLDLTPAQ